MNPTTKKIFFTPGPAALYPTFEQHLRQAIELQIPSISHRGRQFQAIYQATDEALRALFGLPSDYKVLFCSSTNEIWERLLMNCVATHSFHLVNGAFSKKFYQFAQALQLKSSSQNLSMGLGFEFDEINIPTESELIALTHNETSAGVVMPEATLHQFRKAAPQSLIAVDMVSSAPYPTLDFSKIDTAYFSVQKAFGMPAGLGVWLVNEACLAKAKTLEAQGKITGTYHRLTRLWEVAQKFETPETPNVLAIYLLGKVAGDMLEKGMQTLRQETEIKAKMLYDFAENSPLFTPFVENLAHQSPTVIVLNCEGNSQQLTQKLSEKGFVVGSGYGEYKEKQIRIANFPATSVSEIEDLIELLRTF